MFSGCPSARVSVRAYNTSRKFANVLCINHIAEFHKIYNFGAFGDRQASALIRFWGQKGGGMYAF